MGLFGCATDDTRSRKVSLSTALSSIGSCALAMAAAPRAAAHLVVEVVAAVASQAASSREAEAYPKEACLEGAPVACRAEGPAA